MTLTYRSTHLIAATGGSWLPAHAAVRSHSTCGSHPSAWFQLAKFRLTNLRPMPRRLPARALAKAALQYKVLSGNVATDIPDQQSH
jgi:hypothetical protein